MKIPLQSSKQKQSSGEFSLNLNLPIVPEFSFQIYSRISFPVRGRLQEARPKSIRAGRGNTNNMGNLIVSNDYITPIDTRQEDFAKKIPVRIDHRTCILIDPGTSVEKARE